MKQNCWEVKNCGRHQGGEHEKDLGICPATVEGRLDGIHGGTNAGRACWVIAGTLCGGRTQGTFAKKYDNCVSCDFYRKVKNEENGSYQLSIVLMNKLRN